jgi:hypothetical protein
VDPARLFDLVSRIEAAADEIRPAATSPCDAVDLWRITLVANAVARLQAVDVRLLPDDQVAMAAMDAESILEVLQQAVATHSVDDVD